MTAGDWSARVRGVMYPRLSIGVAIAGILAACGGPRSETGFSSGMPTGATATAAESESSSGSSSSGGSSADGTSSTSSSSTSSGSSGSLEDGTSSVDIPDFGDPDPLGCEGRIDFLFVISAGGTMKYAQERLLASFDGFIGAIEQQLPDFDVHILVADPDGGWLISDCSVCTTDCDPQGMPPYCGAMLEPCDKGEIGAGVTFPSGTAATNRRCELDSGLRYITSGQQNMSEAFACIAQVGTGGGGLTGQAMAAAVQPAINNPDDEDACNRGFLRDDALLVVTIIQSDYDEDSQGTVDEWIDALRASKKYDDDAFMLLVLTTDIDVGFEQLCSPDEWNQTKNRLRLLAEGVKHGFIGSICMDNYAPFFAEHVTHLVDLCDDFDPPG